MTPLDKLIQQYERESPGKKARMNIVGDGSIWYDGFVEWLVETYTNSFKHMESQIKSLESRPTCGKEQRKFLDEVEDMGVIDDKVFAEYKIDIDKVIKGE